VSIVLRFMFGFILAGGLALWTGLDFPLNLVLVLTIATVAAIFGDRFILGFMSVMRYLR
jgi:hypothetical protein